MLHFFVELNLCLPRSLKYCPVKLRFSYNTRRAWCLIVGDVLVLFFLQYGQWEKALETLSKLVAEKPPVYSLMWGYNAAISALGKAKQMEGVKDLLATMKASGKCVCRYVGRSSTLYITSHIFFVYFFCQDKYII